MDGRVRWLALPIGTAAVLASAGFTLMTSMAGNPATGTHARDGTGQVSGYRVSDVAYDVDRDDTIIAVLFRTDHVAGDADVAAYLLGVDGSRADYSDCHRLGGTAGHEFRCGPRRGPAIMRAHATGLQVVATR